MATAAVTAGGRARQAAEQARRREALKRQRERRRQLAANVFDRLQISGRLADDQLPEFLQQVMHMKTLDSNGTQMVLDAARASSDTSSSTSNGNHKQEGLGKEALINAVEKYGEYVKHAKMVNEMYEKFDKDKDGGLSRKEFIKALESYERNANRSANGIAIHLIVTDADLDLILEKADANNDGEISKNELLPALAAWEELAAIKVENHESCCVIL